PRRGQHDERARSDRERRRRRPRGRARGAAADAGARVGGAARVKPAPFEYRRPETVEETIALLGQHGDEAKVLAGGQSLVPLLNMRLARPAVLVDINRVADLDNVAHLDGSVRCGALVRQTAFQG